MKAIELETVEAYGDARELGRAHGEACRNAIRAFVEQRLAAVRDYAAERGVEDTSTFVDVAARCLAVVESWDPDGYSEHGGIAEAAGVGAATLYAVANMTDVRDVLLLGRPEAEEGCSAFVVPPGLSADGAVLAGQTWDLNPQDLEFVVAVHRKPTFGPQTWSITCVGCLTLVGMNEHGVCIGTTNIKTHGSVVGVGYLSLVHRAIREGTAGAGSAVIRDAPRAAAHTYWVADEQGAVELECSAARCVPRRLGTEPFARTNHCFDATHREREGETPNSSSHARLRTLETTLARGGHGVDTLRAMYADRSDGADSINRYPEDGTGTATNACIICQPRHRTMWACKGPADRGLWRQLGFGTSGSV